MLATQEQPVRIPRGCIEPENIYTQDGVMDAIGIGRAIKGREKQRLDSRLLLGRQAYYLGKDVIELIVTQASDKPLNAK